MIEQIPAMGDEIGMRAHSTIYGYTLYFANIPFSHLTFNGISDYSVTSQ